VPGGSSMRWCLVFSLVVGCGGLTNEVTDEDLRTSNRSLLDTPDPVAEGEGGGAPVGERARDLRSPLTVQVRATGDQLSHLSVNARKWGLVMVDGRVVTMETPLVGHQVTPGAHDVWHCSASDPEDCTNVKVSIPAGYTVAVGF